MSITMTDAREAAQMFDGIVKLFEKVAAKKLKEYLEENPQEDDKNYNTAFNHGLNAGIRVSKIEPTDVELSDFIEVVFDQSPSEGE